MLAERSKRLEEHHEKLGAIIAKLQIEKAKQVRALCDGYMKLLLDCFSPFRKILCPVGNIRCAFKTAPTRANPFSRCIVIVLLIFVVI